jgi:hypothetical protein
MSLSCGQVGIWNAKLCSAPVDMIIRQKPSESSIFCQSISQVQLVSNMNLRIEGSAGPSASTPDWSSACTLVSLTDGWRGGVRWVDLVSLPGSGLTAHLDQGAFRLSANLGSATSADRFSIILPHQLS